MKGESGVRTPNNALSAYPETKIKMIKKACVKKRKTTCGEKRGRGSILETQSEGEAAKKIKKRASISLTRSSVSALQMKSLNQRSQG